MNIGINMDIHEYKHINMDINMDTYKHGHPYQFPSILD